MFAVEPELAHEISLDLLQQFHKLIPARRVERPTRVMGLDFPNPVGLAAGLDKNGDYLAGLQRLGFGFIEVGSITPRAQPGNAKPRIFRLWQRHSLINRMGFNNKGVAHLQHRLSEWSGDIPIGVNIGKNLDTPVSHALDDYRQVLETIYPQADYVTINISSPNTPGLRQLQDESALESLLGGLRDKRRELEDKHQIRRPMALKLAPDIDDQAIPQLADILRSYEIDALIATNTTITRPGVEHLPLAAEQGGLSGQALRDRSRAVLQAFHQALGDDIPIISVGGIDSAEEASLRLQLGASLVQVYTGLIYRGPGLVHRIARSLSR